mgnify:CR=1 FL=1
MNKDLIDFITICLADGVISDKEREVIFRKSKELGVSDDECEIILEGMIVQSSNTQSESKLVEKPISSLDDKVIEFNEIEYEEISDVRLKQIFSSNFLELISKKKLEISKLRDKIGDYQDEINEVENKILSNDNDFELLQKELKEIEKSNSVIKSNFEEKELQEISNNNNLNFTYNKGEIILFSIKKNIFGMVKKDKEVNLSFSSFLEINDYESKYFLEEKDIEVIEKLKVDIKNKKDLIKNKIDFESQKFRKEIGKNDQDLIKLKSIKKRIENKIELELDEINKLEHKIHDLEEMINPDNFNLLKQLYRKSPVLFQSDIFSKYLEVIEINNDKEIMNLTRFNNFIIDQEVKYSKDISLLFNKLNNSNLKQSEIDTLIRDKKNLISFYSSFHIMYQCLDSKKMGIYMKIYVELETMGIFNTFFENNVMTNLNEMNKYLKKLDSTLKIISSQLSQNNNYLQLLNSKMYQLNLSVDETNCNLMDISHSIQNGNELLKDGNDLLNGINSGVGLNNILTGIQTYQMYKINKQTKGLIR